MSRFKIYTASAGSGKTFQLSRHYLELLLRDTDNYKRILAVTFTNKAAGELKERVVRELVRMSSENPEQSDHFRHLATLLNKDDETLKKRARKILRNILQDYGHFNIGTIDHFFQRVLRSFSKEIGIHSGYKLELNSGLFIAGAVDLLLGGLDEDGSSLKWLGKWADYQIENEKSWANIEKELKSLGKELLREEIMVEMTAEGADRYKEEIISSLEGFVKGIEGAFAKRMKQFAENTAELLERYGLQAADFNGGASRSIPGYLLAASHDRKFLDRVRHYEGIDDPGKWYKQGHSEDEKKRIVNAWENGFRDLLSNYKDYLDQNEIIYKTALLIRQNLFSLGLSGKLMKAMQSYSDETNSLLINLTSPVLANIIGTNPSPFIYEKAGTYYHHFMIDEFQDTSDLQWANFSPLIRNSLGEDNFSMVVGDPKQSIFRWRNSNWKLMAETARRDLDMFGSEEIPLEKNWRSRRGIIDFNNDFFSRAPAIVTDEIKGELKEYRGEKEIEAGSIITNYKTVFQKYGKAAPGGYVRISVQQDDDEGWVDNIPLLVQELQLKYSYKPEDITFLVRRNKEAREIVNMLQAYRENNTLDEKVVFDIVSSESFELQGSAAVRCLVWAIRYILNPSEKYFAARLAHEYSSFKKLTPSDDDLRNIIRIKNDPDSINDLLPPELTEKQPELINASGARLTEEIIRILKLQDQAKDLPFLMAFRDKVLSEIGGTGSPEEILEWWDERGKNENVPMTDQSGAMKVLTIHKAKGLEFKVVIMPYCNWEMGQPKAGELIWVKTDGSKFAMVPRLPVKMSSAMIKSGFSGDYFREKTEIYLDNLNLLYVSFTRAIDRLYVYCPEPAGNVSYPVSRLVKEVLGLKDAATGIYDSGSRDTYPVTHQDKDKPARIRQLSYEPRSYGDLFRLRKAFETSSMHYGSVMHAILEDVKLVEDLDQAILKKAEGGELDPESTEDIRIRLEQLLNSKPVSSWFDGTYRVYAERGILVPGGGEYRPDRIMENDDELIIVDYKFGEARSSHKQQVRNYMSVVRGFVDKQVTGFLLYPDSGELIEVD